MTDAESERQVVHSMLEPTAGGAPPAVRARVPVIYPMEVCCECG
ncbi:hypothetical protein BJ987_002284 [Nocardia goodfellowii]|uniref:Uncharacterized protein n=1 Tax=Nocardia goodfellowii TaxID=882446 RepID=A0ABS4QE64_9NOCA|nr:hypothetical protein [Nocardia goodfellowii]